MDVDDNYIVRVDAASFKYKGGWALDTQFMEQVGKSYLLAHGLGVPVLDAHTDAVLPDAGSWRVWIYTRNWVPDVTDPPGRFQVLIDDKPLDPIFGVAPDAWAWVEGGTINVRQPQICVTLHDLTGFDGRCAAIAFTRSEKPPAERAVSASFPQQEHSFDLVVAGGGIAGTCAALAAARQGLSVALIHDRSVLGGNASQEIRVWCGGEARHPLVREVRNRFMNREPGAAHSDLYRMRLVQDEPTLELFTGWHACGVVQKTKSSSIEAVMASQVETGEVHFFRALLFVDATGDGWIGTWAGADCRMGREAADEYNESMAPDTADEQTLGCSLMWSSTEANADMLFGPLPWAEPAAQGVVATEGEWNWEYGLDLDTIRDAELIRDHLLRVIYGSFSLAKRDGRNARRQLDFVPYNLGKRESRRLLGDVILTENDVRGKTRFPDAVATGTWSIDLHDKDTGTDFLTVCRQPLFGRYYIPFRSLYSRNVDNLMMAGRCFSATHVGLGSPRVMNTTGQMGVAAGCAAAVCRKHTLTPCELAQEPERINELQELIGGDFPGHPDPRYAGWHIIDDTDADYVTVSGDWKKGLHENGDHYGTGFLCCENGAADTWVAYKLSVSEAGRYRLYMIWNRYWNGRANAVPVRITHMQGVTHITVDMNRDSGEWSELGEYLLEPGSSAEIRIETEGTNDIVVADAVAFERIDAGVPHSDPPSLKKNKSWVLAAPGQ